MFKPIQVCVFFKLSNVIFGAFKVFIGYFWGNLVDFLPFPF